MTHDFHRHVVGCLSKDNFGARYYASMLGRFMTPDWSEDPEPTPYADLTNPQTLNLYAYAGNNPTTTTDADGHREVLDWATGGTMVFDTDAEYKAWWNENDFGIYSYPTPGTSGFITTDGQIRGYGAWSPDGDRVAALAADQDAARETFGPNSNGTYCNRATLCIAKDAGAPLGALEANGVAALSDRMTAQLAASPDWVEISPAKAQELADEGKVVIGGLPGGGHVATVRPQGLPGDQIPASGRGPLINNVGYDQRVEGANWAFGKGTLSRIRYYTPRAGSGQ